MKSFIGYAVVDGRILRCMLGVHYGGGGKLDVPVGTYFGAVFLQRRFAVEKAKQWGVRARVVRVKVMEAQ